jgi:hypothetical protein
MRKKIINCQLSIVNWLLLLLVLTATGAQAQVIISDSDSDVDSGPHSGAVLDLKSESRGLLLPQVELTDLNGWELAGAEEPADGMLVYNTGNGVKGIYVWYDAKWNLVIKVKKQTVND